MHSQRRRIRSSVLVFGVDAPYKTHTQLRFVVVLAQYVFLPCQLLEKYTCRKEVLKLKIEDALTEWQTRRRHHITDAEILERHLRRVFVSFFSE